MSAAAAKRAKGKAIANPTAKQKVTSEQPDDRATGLWVNTEFFRKLTTRPPRTIVDEYKPTAEENYYLKLADQVLGPAERRHADRNAAAFRQTQSNTQAKDPVQRVHLEDIQRRLAASRKAKRRSKEKQAARIPKTK